MQTTTRSGTRTLGLIVLTCSGLMVACEAADRTVGEEGDTAAAEGTLGDTAGAPGAGEPEAEPIPLDQLPGDTVQVTLTEYRVDMPTTLAAGRKVFVVRNEGGMDHTFEIESGSAEFRLDPPPAPGETRTLVVEDLTPGTWEVYCPIGNHRDQGMRLQVTVR